MSDSLATNLLLKKLLELNRYKNIVELVNNFLECLIDTKLFLAMERLFTEGKTSNEDFCLLQQEQGTIIARRLLYEEKRFHDLQKAR